MADITLRSGLGRPLTNDEVDDNFTNLNDDKLESTDLSVSTGAASGGGTLSYSAGVFTFAPADLSSYVVDLSSFTTTDLAEGTNLYYTNERVDDRVNTLIQAGLGITTSYDDVAGELTIESDTIEELCKNGTGSTILKGTPVYQTGTAGNFMEIAPADASSAATMPAVGVLGEDLTAGAEGTLLLMGRISDVDTSAFSEGDIIYVASGGGYTNVRPTGQSVLVQNLGRVTKVHASNGGGVVMGSGRSNDVPNLTDGNIFIGNASGTYDKRAIVTADISDLTATFTELNYTDGVTSSIQTQLNSKLPSSSYTASDVLTKIKTVDGSGSGLDADLLDGQQGSYYTGYTDTAIANLVDSAPATLDTLNELAAALGDDPNFATTVTNSIATKAPLASPTFTGTATMDELTVDGNTTIDGTLLFTGSASRIRGGLNQPFSIDSRGNATGEGVKITHNNDAVALFDINGDISFYEDTGTTPKFFWDASAESLGIGTSSPVGLAGATVLQVHDSGTNYAQLRLTNATSGSTANQGFEINASGTNVYINNRENGFMSFNNNGSERFRVDTSGNLLVGTTNPDVSFGTTTGSSLQSSGQTHHSSSGTSLILNRTASDGTIAQFRKGGTTVGSIGSSYGDRINIGTGNTGLMFRTSSRSIDPADPSTGLIANGMIDLGRSANPFKDLYLSGTANVSNVKETVYALTGTALDAGNGGIQTKTLAANTTFTDSLASGDAIVLQLEAGASYTVTYPTMQWVTSGGNVAPTLTAKDVLVFWKVSSTLYGAYVGSYV